ncbi:MAG: acetamidase/formamidase family protein [Thermomicrobiales bacterium]
MATFTIEPERSTLHGVFSQDFAPVLTVDPGDSVVYRTLDAAWALEPHRADGTLRRKFEPREPARDNGHALRGPVAIRGAEPGMTLAVRIDELCPEPWGWTVAGGCDTAFNRRLGVVEGDLLPRWAIDVERGVCRDQFGREIGLRPFMGVMGMPGTGAEPEPSWTPRSQGGNIDCKELIAGSTLFLPIAVPGGLFSTGDGHAAQGDGEVSGTAVECPMERVVLTFDLLPDLHLTMPRALTPAGWITFGFHEDLHEATMIALEATVEWIEGLYGLNRHHAVALASLAVDLRVTQIVNLGVMGVHAVLPNGALRFAQGLGGQS